MGGGDAAEDDVDGEGEVGFDGWGEGAETADGAVFEEDGEVDVEGWEGDEEGEGQEGVGIEEVEHGGRVYICGGDMVMTWEGNSFFTAEMETLQNCEVDSDSNELKQRTRRIISNSGAIIGFPRKLPLHQ